MPQPHAIIIGAGIAGIATAIRLAAKGYEVEVFEANSYPGGKLSEFSFNNYRFDAGPSLFTMPQYVDELFELAGRQSQKEFRYKKLDILCQYFYPDGTQLTAHADQDKLAREVTQKTNDDARAVSRYFKKSKIIYDITHHVFLEKSLHRVKTYLSWRTLKSLFCFSQIDAFRTMNQANQSLFVDKRMVQFFNRYATYNGSNPYLAPATLNVIPHLEQFFGAYFPENGMYSITTALVDLAKSIGVKFNYNSPVDEIVIKKRQVKGIMVRGAMQTADVLVSNMDVFFTYHKLLRLHPKVHPAKILNQERSSSALIFYWGIKKTFSQLDLHNVFFSADYETEFDAIWKHKTIDKDPTVYLNISSKLKTDDAPPGCENWFTMINVPANVGQDWDVLIKQARENILQKLSRIVGEDIKALIDCESILDPRSIESKTSSYRGSIYGTSSNGQFSAFLRHANRSSKIKNLYFCGGSVHPGGGIPLALLSAKIVSDWVGG